MVVPILLMRQGDNFQFPDEQFYAGITDGRQSEEGATIFITLLLRVLRAWGGAGSFIHSYHARPLGRSRTHT